MFKCCIWHQDHDLYKSEAELKLYKDSIADETMPSFVLILSVEKKGTCDVIMRRIFDANIKEKQSAGFIKYTSIIKITNALFSTGLRQ